MTGAPSTCWVNDCHPLLSSTVADEVVRYAGERREDVAVFASWEPVSRAATTDASRIVMRTGKEGRGVVPAYPGYGDYCPDAVTSARAIEHLVAYRPRFLWLALGDTD